MTLNLRATTARPESPDTSSVPIDTALRDWFAGQALVGLLTAPSRPGVPALAQPDMARAAYQFADAMMLARGS